MDRLKTALLTNSRIFLWALVVLVTSTTAYLFLMEREYPVPYLQISTLHQIIIVGGELLIIIFLYKIYLEKSAHQIKFQSLILLFLIINCFFALPFLGFYLDKTRLDVPIINRIQPYLLPGYYALLILTSAFVLISYQDVKQVRNWLISEFDKKRFQDKQNAAVNATQFRKQYPNIANIPILGNLAVKLFQEGLGYVFSILGLITIGMTLRLWNLDVLPPWIDEIFHLNAARTIHLGTPLDQVEYRRSLYTVTLPVVLSFNFFGLNLWAARFPGVLMNTLAVIPLYLISKRVNKSVAILAVGLYIFNPWIISISRKVREYAYYALYFYLVVWIIVKLYEAIPNNLVPLTDFHKLLTMKIFSLTGALIFILYYTNSIDELSTFKLIYLTFPVFGLLLLRKIKWRSPSHFLWFILLFTIIVIGFFFLYDSGKYSNINGEFNKYFISLFYDHPIQQWYYNRPLVSIFVLLCALLATAFFDQKKFVLPFMVLTYIIFHLSFALLAVRGNKGRYAISVEFWHIAIMAAGLFAAYIFLQKLFSNKNTWVLWIGLVFIFWNIPHSISPSLHTTSGLEPVTGEYHANMTPAHTYLLENFVDGEVLITTSYINGNFEWLGGLGLSNIINYWEDEQIIYDAIETYPQGWIVLDYQRGFLWRQPLPFENFSYEDKQVSFLGWFGDLFIFQWSEDV